MSAQAGSFEDFAAPVALLGETTLGEAVWRAVVGRPMPVSGDPFKPAAIAPPLKVTSARRSPNTWRSTGGRDVEDGEVYPAEFGCDDCGLYYSWPITEGLAPKDDPLQVDMLRLVREHETECPAVVAGANEEEAIMTTEIQSAAEPEAEARCDESNWIQVPRPPASNEVSIRAAIRKRDGDQCRFCGDIVNFPDRKSPLAGCYVHVDPTQTAGFVVACRRCVFAQAGADLLLRPAPERPVYSAATIEWLGSTAFSLAR